MNDFTLRARRTRYSGRWNQLMARHARPCASWRRRLLRAQWLPVGDDLLRNGDVRIRRRETAGAIQQTLRNAIGETRTQFVQACDTIAFDCTRLRMSFRFWAAC